MLDIIHLIIAYSIVNYILITLLTGASVSTNIFNYITRNSLGKSESDNSLNPLYYNKTLNYVRAIIA